MISRFTVSTLALTVALIGLVAPDAQAARTLVKPAPTSSVAHPMPSEVFTLRGKLGRSVARTAALQRLDNGTWVRVAKARLPKSGAYTWSVTQPSFSTTWRVLARKVKVKGHTYPARVSRPLLLTREAHLAKVTPTTSVKTGGVATVAVAVTPVRPGTPVRIEVNTGTGWTTLANLAEDADGRATATWNAPADPGPLAADDGRGSARFRATVPGVAGSSGVTSPTATTYVLPQKPILIAAHRGASSQFPENSWNSYNSAMQQRADWIETDFRRSAPNPIDIADGPCAGPAGSSFWMIVHDPSYNRTTNVAKVFPGRETNGIATFTCSEAKMLKVDSFRGSGLTEYGVPTLGEFVTWIGQFEQTYGYADERIMLEFKLTSPSGFADFYDDVKRLAPNWIDADPTSHNDKAVFSAFSYDTVFTPLLDPMFGSTTGLPSNDRVSDGAELSSQIDDSSDVIPDQPTTLGVTTRWVLTEIEQSLLTAGLAATAHDKVDLVAAWTVNDPADMAREAATGADIIITDRLPEARTVLLR